MMRYRELEVFNFKGIEHLRLDLAKAPNLHVFTLIGLNESGKTTILEAINYFSSNPDSLEALGLQGYKIEDPHSLIPIAKESNFNGEVKIVVRIELTEADVEQLRSQLRKTHRLEAKFESQVIEVTQKVTFRDSRYISGSTHWKYPVKVKTKQAKSWRELNYKEVKSTNLFVIPRLPSILYFPNFLFDFPNKIFIDTPTDSQADETEKFYKMLIQDILDSLNNNLSLERHILYRAKSDERNDKRALDKVLLDMGREVTSRVFGAWGRIFKQKISDKKIVIDCEQDEDGRYFLVFKIEDRDGYYLINQRSLGFRWFFVFLLLTEYRGFRKQKNENILFLFDEPASNLHSTAQTQLLESFKRLSENCYIIYTTHSHYMINPDWLEGAFVVRNEGIDYTTTSTNFTQKNAKITATRYREFVSQHPSQTTYFKPVLDVLDWAPSQLELVPRAVFVEGKNDFYILKYLMLCLEYDANFGFMPAGGSGSSEPLISLYIGWGRPFCVLLDADKEGKKQKERYKKLFGEWIASLIIDYSDVDPSWQGRALETVLTENDKKRIMRKCGFEYKDNKQVFARCVQELLAKDEIVTLTNQGQGKLRRLFDFLREEINQKSE